MNKTFGIAGNMGTGKSTLAKAFAELIQLQVVELDDLRRYALWDSSEVHHKELRQKLAYVFDLALFDGWLDRKEFTKTLFSSSQNLNLYSKIATPLLIQDTQNLIDTSNQHCAIVWAWLLEEGYSSLLDSFVILTHCSEERLTKELDNDSLIQRRSLEPTFESRLAYSKTIPIIEFDNSGTLNRALILKIVEKINE